MRKQEIMKWARYNQRLYYTFAQFVERNRAAIESDEPRAKLALLQQVRHVMEGSAVMNKDMPLQYVPMQKVYREIHSALFQRKWFSEPYFVLLKEVAEGKKSPGELKKREEAIVGIIEHALARASLPGKDRAAGKLEHVFKQLAVRFVPQMKGLFTKAVFAGLLAVYMLNLCGNAFAGLEAKPFMPESTKIEKAMQLAENTAHSIHGKSIYVETEEGKKSLQEYITDLLDDANLEQIGQWLVETGIISTDVWQDAIGEPFDMSINIVKDHVQKRLDAHNPGEYEVVVANVTYSHGNASDVTRSVKVGGSLAQPLEAQHSFAALGKDLSARVAHEIRKPADVSDPAIAEHSYFQYISCDMSNNGHIVFTVHSRITRYENRASQVSNPVITEKSAQLVIIPRA